MSFDNSTVDLELEALPDSEQPSFNKFSSPLQVLNTVSNEKFSRSEKEEFIKNTPGAKPILSTENLTDAELNNRFNQAQDIAEQIKEEEILAAIKKKQKNCE